MTYLILLFIVISYTVPLMDKKADFKSFINIVLHGKCKLHI